MTKSVVEALEETRTSVNTASERIIDDIRTVARLLMAYRVAIRKFESAIQAKSAESQDLLTDRFTFMAAITQIEEVLTGLEDYCIADLSIAASGIESVLEFAKERRAASEEHSLTDPDVRRQVLDLTGGRCAYCSIDLKDGGGDGNQFCIEHVVPASKGGPNHITNYVPSCRSCNNSKGDRHVLYFIQNSFVLRQRVTP